MSVKLPEFLYSGNSASAVSNNDQTPNYKIKTTLIPEKAKKFKLKFADKGLIKVSEILNTYFDNASYSNSNNYLNKVNIKIKLLFLIFILLLISFLNSIVYQLTITIILIFLSAILIIQNSNKNFTKSYIKKILYPTFFLGFLLSFPASFNFIINGEPIINLIHLNKEYKFWIYELPENIFISKEGLSVTILITLRVFNSICSSILIIQSEPIEKFIDSLKIIFIPSSVRFILLITQKYIISFSRSVLEYYFSLKSRLFTEPDKSILYKITGTKAFLLYRKTKSKFNNIALAMKSRGIYNI